MKFSELREGQYFRFKGRTEVRHCEFVGETQINAPILGETRKEYIEAGGYKSMYPKSDREVILIEERTPKEIEILKKNWMNDPCWDLGTTEGFELHKEELKAFEKKMWQKWKTEREKEVKDRAVANNISFEDQEKIDALRSHAADKSDSATSLLIHYLKATSGLHFDSDMMLEIRCIIDNIIESAVATAKADLILKK